jgi:hypothetical protein
MKHTKILGWLILPVILFSLTACSDDKAKTETPAPAKSASASKTAKHNHVDLPKAVVVLPSIFLTIWMMWMPKSICRSMKILKPWKSSSTPQPIFVCKPSRSLKARICLASRNKLTARYFLNTALA